MSLPEDTELDSMPAVEMVSSERGDFKSPGSGDLLHYQMSCPWPLLLSQACVCFIISRILEISPM